ncbi:MAG: hypothetical protein HRK26_05295 [Rickettsiaceae bacterium H1]|nr:hypothetical protein [Rickettsiaceae bacterium H1]
MKVEYGKVKEVLDNQPRQLIIIPYIYTGSGTSAHTDIIIVRTDENNKANVTYVATANWLVSRKETRYKVKDVKGKEHVLTEKELNAVLTSKDRTIFLQVDGRLNKVMFPQELEQKATQKKILAQMNLEQAQGDVKKKINFFCSVNSENCVYGFEPLFKVESQKIEVIQPCISWKNLTCGHAAIEGALRHVFAGDKSVNAANEGDVTEKIPMRLEKLHVGQTDQVIEEIKNQYGQSRIWTGEKAHNDAPPKSAQEKKSQKEVDKPQQVITKTNNQNCGEEDKKGKNKLLIGGTILVSSLIILGLATAMAEHNVKNISICATLIAATLIVSCLIFCLPSKLLKGVSANSKNNEQRI